MENRLIACCATVMLALSVANCQAQQSPPSYPPPLGEENAEGLLEWEGWTPPGKGWMYAAPGDPRSPRAAKLVDDVEQAPEATLRDAFEVADVDVQSMGDLEPLEVAFEMTGHREYVGLGRTRLGGVPAVVFVLLSRHDDEPYWAVKLLEAPVETFAAWGGVTAMMLAFRIFDDPAVFPPHVREAVGQMKPEDQITFYEQAYTLRLNDLLLATVMINANTLRQMRALNFDLLEETYCPNGCAEVGAGLPDN